MLNAQGGGAGVACIGAAHRQAGWRGGHAQDAAETETWVDGEKV
jgi:hypothetical protein